MNFIKKSWPGLALCLAIAMPSYVLGKHFPIIGGPVIAIIIGMIVALFIKNKSKFESGVRFTSKKILQYAVILLGFGLNLSVVLKTGKQSLPIIVGTIAASLIIALFVHKIMHIPSKISTLIGVGSSICGGSAIAATAPVINADDQEVAQSISVIFFFNVLAAIIFPPLGKWLGFSGLTGEAFGVFAGTAINDTSSVTAAAATWDSIYNLGSATLDKAVTVKLTRTLAIIPITLALAFFSAKKKGNAGGKEGMKVNIKNIFPFFIVYFVLASVVTTIATGFGVPYAVFTPFKELSKFFIILAMAAIGLNTNIVKLVKSGGKPIILGFCCWLGIIASSLALQHVLAIW